MALDIFKAFATNSASENNGAAVKFSDTTFTIARAGNPKYSRLLASLVEKHQKELNLKDAAADALSDKILIDVLAETILLGWDELEYKGKPLPYSVENAKLILSHKDFRKEVSRMSDDIDNFRAKLEDEQVKN